MYRIQYIHVQDTVSTSTQDTVCTLWCCVLVHRVTEFPKRRWSEKERFHSMLLIPVWHCLQAIVCACVCVRVCVYGREMMHYQGNKS